MLTEKYLKDHFVDAYFIDSQRQNIEVLTTSEDKKQVIPTIIPLDENNHMFTALKTVMSLDEIHENTYKKKDGERKLFEAELIRIAKNDGLVIDKEKNNAEFFPTLVKGIIENGDNEDHLFALKLALFEVEKIRDSENAELKASIRKGKTKVEVLLNALKLISE